ncbi:hypothetical protein CBR_g34284 [Chara braunii]|uniref:UvrD-like helicase C-terminal domain-containing protein n=1 Tax=Chara braunii TaxID=69332 RepID=A0A388JYR3_CHABU|nr:hypothetical protein CBR_g34284 [Chara braunii]|eukprot:GBG62912.1 hypothetical protein CBR_g34284 [Chara braunii]
MFPGRDRVSCRLFGQAMESLQLSCAGLEKTLGSVLRKKVAAFPETEALIQRETEARTSLASRWGWGPCKARSRLAKMGTVNGVDGQFQSESRCMAQYTKLTTGSNATHSLGRRNDPLTRGLGLPRNAGLRQEGRQLGRAGDDELVHYVMGHGLRMCAEYNQKIGVRRGLVTLHPCFAVAKANPFQHSVMISHDATSPYMAHGGFMRRGFQDWTLKGGFVKQQNALSCRRNMWTRCNAVTEKGGKKNGASSGRWGGTDTSPGRWSTKRHENEGDMRVDGVVMRIVFRNIETGYMVVRLKPSGNALGEILQNEKVKKASEEGREATKGGRRKKGTGKGNKTKNEVIITVVGCLGGVSEGSAMSFVGKWRESKYGLELVASKSVEIRPSSVADIQRYLAGGVIPGLGPVKAEAMVSAWGDKTLDVLDSEDAITQLCKVKGIGRKIADMIKKEWDARRFERGAMTFLTEHRVPPLLAHYLVLRHGAGTENAVRADPWSATDGVEGWNFLHADELAKAVGVDPNLRSRMQMALDHVLNVASYTEGHSYLPWRTLFSMGMDILHVEGWSAHPERSQLEEAIEVLVEQGRVVIENSGVVSRPTGVNQPSRRRQELEEERRNGWVLGDARCFLRVLHEAETSVAEDLSRRVQRTTPVVLNERVARWVTNVESASGMKLSRAQRESVVAAASAPILILTGGPGCGKTFTTWTIVKLWRAMGKKVQLCAPTGRAAQRLAEAAKLEAKTIHRLLEYKPREGEMNLRKRRKDRPRRGGRCRQRNVDDNEEDDEANLSRLMEAVSDAGPLDEGAMGQFERNSTNLLDASAIVTNAHAINRGVFPNLEKVQLSSDMEVGSWGAETRTSTSSSSEDVINPQTLVERQGRFGDYEGTQSGEGLWKGELLLQEGRTPSSVDTEERHKQTAAAVVKESAQVRSSHILKFQTDCLWVEVPDFRIEDSLKEIISAHLPSIGLDPYKDVQVLSPMRKGPLGTFRLNKGLQELLNAKSESKKELQHGEFIFREGDRVIQQANDYETGVFNGDVGTVLKVDTCEKLVMVKFQLPSGEEKVVAYEPLKMLDLLPAWAITIHKSQGSEYPVVLLPLSNSHDRLLSRKLLYTGLTRAQGLAIIIGPRKPIALAINRVHDEQRNTFLEQRLLKIHNAHQSSIWEREKERILERRELSSGRPRTSEKGYVSEQRGSVANLCEA